MIGSVPRDNTLSPFLGRGCRMCFTLPGCPEVSLRIASRDVTGIPEFTVSHD